MKNLTWQNPEQLIVAQELIIKVKTLSCGIKDYKDKDADTTIKLSTTLHFKSHDEQIGQLIVDRNYMLKYGTLSFDNSNVNLKAPIVHE